MSETTTNSSESYWKFSEELQIPPVRSIDEFILNRARFQLPPYTDLPKWNNRILTNLLYFQTNYFIIMLIFVFISFAAQASHVMFGCSAIALLLAAVFLSASKNPTLDQIRSDHPILTLIVNLLALYYFIGALTSVCVVLFILLMPVLLILIHASFRLRNLKAKINRQLERAGLEKTVMSRILSFVSADISILD
uniref:PRA1 family protein n=1 Tax=Syphacia muris TaxID=451379 RepID=A0A0N5AWI6_9BILA